MAKLVEDSWANAVQFEVSRTLRVTMDGGTPLIVAPCSTCHGNFELRYSKRYPPDIIRRKMQDQGWRTGKHLTCPHCVKTRPGATKRTKLVPTKFTNPDHALAPAQPLAAVLDPVQQALDQMAKSAEPKAKAVASLAQLDQLLAPAPKAPPAAAPAPPAAPPEPTPPAAPAQPAPVDRKAHIAMMKLLEEYFGDSRGVYRRGADGQPYSDARVAQESGAPLAHVQEEREKWFGVLRGTEDLDGVRTELDALRQSVEHIVQQAQEQADRVRAEYKASMQQAQQQCEAKVDLLMKFAREAVQDLLERTEVLAAEVDEVLKVYKT